MRACLHIVSLSVERGKEANIFIEQIRERDRLYVYERVREREWRDTTKKVFEQDPAV